MAFFLGLDAGGTKTTAALGDDTRILVRATGGSIKPLRVSLEQAQENLAALLADVAQQSGIDMRQIAASCVGTAGLRLPQTDGWMRQIISRCAGGAIVSAATRRSHSMPPSPAALACWPWPEPAPTRWAAPAQVNFSLSEDGDRCSAIKASGYWIGHRALRAAFRAKDFGQPTRILDRVLNFWNEPQSRGSHQYRK